MVEGLSNPAARAEDLEGASRMGAGMHAVVDGPSFEFDGDGNVTGVLMPSGGNHRL